MMSKKIFLLFAMITAGCNVPTSHNVDDNLFSSSICSGTTDFCAAQAVLEAKCISCHTGYHNSWAEYKTAAAWLNDSNQALVVPGDSGNSQMYRRLNGSGFEEGMPDSSSGFSWTEEERIAIQTFLDGI